jgi:predicted GNAT family N-acyltransferase
MNSFRTVILLLPDHHPFDVIDPLDDDVPHMLGELEEVLVALPVLGEEEEDIQSCRLHRVCVRKYSLPLSLGYG